MSNTVDERVVSMKFDNKQFESGVQTSLGTLDKLKQSLNFKDVGKSFESISTAAGRVDMSPLSNGVETVKTKFSALQIMATTALANITNAAVNKGKEIASALSLNSIKDGFAEYETQMNAVQTILANTSKQGTTLEDVNSALDELNTYADKTIYNFTEMTKNIGTFTASGLDLDTSVKAIQGIANLAAVSGSTSQQASSAMYQLSQALAAGTVQLQDWNSVVNAGMGGKVFQDAIIETAEEMGTVDESIIKAYKSGKNFRTLLNAKDTTPWLSSDILATTLEKFTKTGVVEYLSKMSGISEANMKKLQKLGDTAGYDSDEFKALASSLAGGNSEMVKSIKDALSMATTAEKAATEVKTFSQLIDTLKEVLGSGWTQSWEIIIGDFEEAKKLWTEVSDYFGDVINKSALARNNMLEAWDKGGGRTKAIEAVKNAFEGLLNIIKPIKEAFREVFPAVTAKQLLDITENVRSMTAEFKSGTKHTANLKSNFEDFFGTAKSLINSIKNILSGLLSIIRPIIDAFRETFSAPDTKKLLTFAETIQRVTAGFKLNAEQSEKLKTAFKGLFAVIGIVVDFVKELIGGLKKLSENFDVFNKLDGVGDKFLDGASAAGEWLIGLRKSIKESDAFGKAVNSAVKFIQKAIDKIKEFASYVGDKIPTPGWDDFLGTMQSIWDVVKKVGSVIYDVGSEICSEIGDALSKAFRNGDIKAGFDILNGGLLATVLIGIKQFVSDAGGYFEDLISPLDGLKEALSSWEKSVNAKSLLKIAIAIGILAASLLLISAIDPEKLTGSITALASVFGELMLSMVVFSKLNKNIAKGVASIVAVSAAILILVIALKQIAALDWEQLGKGLLGMAGIGAVTLMMKPLASASSLCGSAMKGVLAVSAVIAEIGVMIAAFGALAQIPGLDWLIDEGGDLLESIGVAIGKLLGGIVGGTMEGITGSLPQVGTDLSDFMTNAKPFMDGVKNFDASAMEGVKSLTETIVLLTAAELVEGVTSWLTGGSSLASFANQLVPFANAIVDFSSIVSGNVDRKAVTAAANAGKVLAEMASALPNSGGVAGFFAGENDLDVFAEKIVPFANAIVDFSSIVAGNVDEDAVSAAANAGKTLSNLAATLPNSGGVMGFFTGENDIDTFGEKIGVFGHAIVGFSSTVAGNINEDAVTSAANAGKMLCELANNIPNSGGVQQWFEGEHSISEFSEDIPKLGNALKRFGDSLGDDFSESKVTSAANAAKAIADMSYHIPNSGGVVQWFAGEHSISDFADDIPKLGSALKKFGDSLGDDFSESKITAASNAATAIADMTNHIPNSNGVTQWFTGEHNISNFAGSLPDLGKGLKSFGDSLGDDFSESKITAAANAATAIADMTDHIPKENGVVQWFTGETSISKFADNLGDLGKGLNKFAENLGDDFSESKVNAAANAATAIADMTEHIPKEDGVVQWFTGSTSISKFAGDLGTLGSGLKKFGENLGEKFNGSKITTAANAAASIAKITDYLPKENGVKAWFEGTSSISNFADDLPDLGKGLKGFGDSLGENFSETKVTAAANAAEAIAKVIEQLPEEGGVVQWFTGQKQNLSDFANNLPDLGKGLKSFSDSLGENFKAKNVSAASDAAKDIAEMTKTAPENSSNLAAFGENIVTFGDYLSDYFNDIVWIPVESIERSSDVIKSFSNFTSKIDSSKMTKSVDAVDSLVDTLNKLAKIKETSADGFDKSVTNLGKVNVTSFIKTFTDSESKVTKSGESLITALCKGIRNKDSDTANAAKKSVNKFTAGLKDNTENSAAKKAFSAVVTACLNETTSKDITDKFTTAGKNLVQGFANGVSSNSELAAAKAKAMAELTVTAIKTALGIASPSKVFYKIGSFTGEGFVNALGDYEARVYKASEAVGDSAKKGLGRALYRLGDIADGEIDTQPTIRPVLDLSEVSRGADSISDIFNSRQSVRISSNVDSISSSMNEKQNVTNGDIISAIKELSRKAENTPSNTYNINGITYDDGSNITEAVKTLVRAARIERRI